MIPLRIFISSVQKELAEERASLRDYLQGDAMLHRFFEVFLFEDVPAADHRADACYLDEVQRCDIYLGIFGNDYGWEEGTVFELIEQAKDFVLSKIDLWTGDRSQSVQVFTAYEIPQEVVAETIVNAVCHRDYSSNASVQVMLFKDRLEVWNPGSLPPGLTLEKLKQPHHSVPANPLIAESLYLTKYIERMGTGIRDMIQRCRAAGLPEPEIRIDSGVWTTTIRRKLRILEATTEATTEAKRLLLGLHGEMTRQELQEKIGLKNDEHFRKAYVLPALHAGLIEMTIPGSPRSPKQKYRLTDKGIKIFNKIEYLAARQNIKAISENKHPRRNPSWESQPVSSLSEMA